MDRQMQAAKALHQRRLSSTPIKSPRPPPPKAQLDCSRTGTSPCSEALGVECSGGEAQDSEEESGVDVANGNHPHVSNDSYCSGSGEFADQGVDKGTAFPSSLYFPMQPNPPYNKSSYQDDCRGAGSDATDADEEDEVNDNGDSVLMNPDDSTLVEDSDGHQGGLEFDDDDTWNDLEETAVSLPTHPPKATANQRSPSERTLTRKVAASRGAETSTGPILASQEPPEPTIPAAQLMTRLFPSLKPNATVPVVPEPRQTDEAPGKTTPRSGQSTNKSTVKINNWHLN